MALRRWIALLVPIAIPIYVFGRKLDLWGSGTGEFWELALVLWTAAAVVGVALGVVVGRWVFDRPSSARTG